MNSKVVRAVFKRNFAGYFSNPLGYVFICAFVLLSGMAAFWPNEFFNSNLATLDQLNRYLPLIMLVFIPAITMSIWAEERRQGTDELLLTLPGRDVDIVVGKYLATLAIFTVALLFSVTNIVVLRGLGRPDLGLLIGNYLGYWSVGAAMLAVGMLASFLTPSLTVAFILALALNAPLVFAHAADAIVPWDHLARSVKTAGLAVQFRDFGNGVMTLSSLVYFASIAVIGLYISMALIGRRHWAGGQLARAKATHFTVRSFCLIAMAIAVNVIAARYGFRVDLTQERVNSLSPQTLAMLRSLDTPRPVYVEAYISPEVPEEYVQTRLNLLAMLREVDAQGGDRVQVRIHEVPRFSQVEVEAETQFGIRPQPVQSQAGGKFQASEIMLGAAFTCGLDKVVVPFFDRGIPVEYEVIRSIATVSQQKRKRIGVLTTDAKLFGGFDMDSFSNRPNQQIIDELQKQYDVEQVNPSSPITERFDALLAVQPSSLTPPQIQNFLSAVRSGQPTVIFEDPFPFLDGQVPATSAPRPPRSRNLQQQPPEPKGDIAPLWRMLGVQFTDRAIVWQNYNPYPKLSDMPREFVFIGAGAGGAAASNAFNANNPVTAGLQQMLTLFPGSILPIPGSGLQFTPLLQTGNQTGTVMFDDIVQRDFLGRGNLNPQRRLIPTGQSYILAAHIEGHTANGPDTEAGTINVILVSDIDVMYHVFFAMRARGRDANDPIDLQVDNVAFVLNTLDYLAGDDRFIDIRKRRHRHRTLTALEQRTESARDSAAEEREKFIQQFETKRTEEQQRLQERLDALQKRQNLDLQQVLAEVATAQRIGQSRLDATIAQLEKERDRQVEAIERKLSLQVRQVQNTYKLIAILFPPILPLALGAFVYHRRRSMERIGVPKARLK